MTDEKYVISCHFRGRDSTVYSMYHTTVPVARYGLLWQLRTCLDMFVFGSTQDGSLFLGQHKTASSSSTGASSRHGPLPPGSGGGLVSWHNQALPPHAIYGLGVNTCLP